MSTQNHPTTFSQFPVSPHAPTTLTPNIFHQILRHTNDMLNKEFYISRNDHLSQHHANIDDSMRYTPSTSPYATHLYHSPSPHIVHSPADRSKQILIDFLLSNFVFSLVIISTQSNSVSYKYTGDITLFKPKY